MKFDIRQTNIAKGIAVLMLLWLHLFRNLPETFDRYLSVYKISGGGTPIEAYIGVFCGVCVSLFVFLTGYGLYFSYAKAESKKHKNVKFVLSHLMNLFSNYWFIFIVFVPLGFAFNRNPIEIYEGSLLKLAIDFFGLSNLFYGMSSLTMNSTWWYMSLVIGLYILFPIVAWCVRKNELATLAISLMLVFVPAGYSNICRYIYALVIGMLFAKHKVFEAIGEYCKKKSFFVTAFSSVVLIIIAFLFRQIYLFENNKFDGILCIPVILFAYLVISRIKFVDKVFEILGKYSGAIFMFHTFIFSYYFKDFIYSFKYSVLIFVVLAVICLAIAVAIEWIKKIIGYNKLFDFLIKKL